VVQQRGAARGAVDDVVGGLAVGGGVVPDAAVAVGGEHDRVVVLAQVGLVGADDGVVPGADADAGVDDQVVVDLDVVGGHPEHHLHGPAPRLGHVPVDEGVVVGAVPGSGEGYLEVAAVADVVVDPAAVLVADDVALG
jgi:hypothetical protein